MGIDCRNCLVIPFEFGYLHLMAIIEKDVAREVCSQRPDSLMYIPYPSSNPHAVFQFTAEFNPYFLNSIWTKRSDKKYIQSLLHSAYNKVLAVDWRHKYTDFGELLSKNSHDPLIRRVLEHSVGIDALIGSFPLFLSQVKDVRDFLIGQAMMISKSGLNPKLHIS